jgi:hypothetical protein
MTAGFFFADAADPLGSLPDFAPLVGGAPRGAAAFPGFGFGFGAGAAAFFNGNGFSGFLAFLAAGRAGLDARGAGFFFLEGFLAALFAGFDGLRVIERVLRLRSSGLVKSRRG